MPQPKKKKTVTQKALGALNEELRKSGGPLLKQALKQRKSGGPLLKQALKQRNSKYHNRRTATPDGTFDSHAEAKRWAELKLLVKAGKIFDLRRQVRIPLHVDGKRIGFYVADFVYCRLPVKSSYAPGWGFSHGAVVEDVKGVRTALFKWKANHLEAEYGFAITEVKA